MKLIKKAILLIFSAAITFAIMYSWLISQSNSPIEGVLQVNLINRCDLEIYDKSLQPFRNGTVLGAVQGDESFLSLTN